MIVGREPSAINCSAEVLQWPIEVTDAGVPAGGVWGAQSSKIWAEWGWQDCPGTKTHCRVEWAHGVPIRTTSDLVITFALARAQHTGFACLVSFELLRANMFSTVWAFNHHTQILPVVFPCIVPIITLLSSFLIFRTFERSTPLFNLGFRSSHALILLSYYIICLKTLSHFLKENNCRISWVKPPNDQSGALWPMISWCMAVLSIFRMALRAQLSIKMLQQKVVPAVTRKLAVSNSILDFTAVTVFAT